MFSNILTTTPCRERADIEGTLSGPLLLDGLTFFAAGRYLDEIGYLYGQRVYNTYDNDAYSAHRRMAYVYHEPEPTRFRDGKDRILLSPI